MENLNIKINKHSSIKITENGKVFYFDPFELRGKFNDADYIFITHDHYDHLDPKSIQNAMNVTTKFICPISVSRTLASDAGIKDTARIISLNAGDKIELEDNISVEAIPAYNVGKNFHKKEYGWLGYILDVSGRRFYVAGDSDETSEMRQVKCDVALIPIGGTYTMNVNEAADIINTIKPKMAIPTHYGSIVGEYELGKKFLSLVNADIETMEIIVSERLV